MPSGDLREKRRPERLLRLGAAIAIIGGSSYVAMVAGIVRSVMLMRLIGPVGRGIQRSAGLLIGYLGNADIAFRHGLSKQLPLAIGAEDDERAGEIEDAAYIAVTLITSVAALVLLAYALFMCPAARPTRIALATAAGILLAQELTQLYWCVLRSWSNFTPLAVGELVRTASQFVLMVGGALLMGVTGVMLGWLAASLVLLVYLHYVSRITIRARLNWRLMGRLALVGLPIAAISFSDYLLRTVDGAIIVAYYGQEQFGLYSLAMQMATYLFAIPRSAGFVIWPKVLEAYGAADDPRVHHQKTLLPTIASASIMPVIGGLAWIVLPVLVPMVVPRFEPGIPAAQVLSMGATFLALPIATDPSLVAGNAEFVVMGTKLVGAGVSAGSIWYLVTHQAPLISIAWAACLGFGISALLSLFLQFRRSCANGRQTAIEVALAFAPLVWSIGALWGAHSMVLAVNMRPDEIDGAVLALFAFIVLSSPCLIYGHVRTGFGKQLGSMLKGKFRHD